MNSSNAYAPPKAPVADIDPAAAEVVLAGRGMRLLAAILDSIIVGILVYAPLIITGDLRSASEAAVRTGDPMAMYSGFFGAGGLIASVACLVWAVITYRLVRANGQTIAKKLLNIKVVRSDGSKAGVGRIFWLRNVVNSILGIIPVYVLIDVLFIFGERRQCLHDKIADTIVVNA
jgi:uncharacterized RDD family membrane protein YckC